MIKQKQIKYTSLAREGSDSQAWIMDEALKIECTPRQADIWWEGKQMLEVGVNQNFVLQVWVLTTQGGAKLVYRCLYGK